MRDILIPSHPEIASGGSPSDGKEVRFGEETADDEPGSGAKRRPLPNHARCRLPARLWRSARRAPRPVLPGLEAWSSGDRLSPGVQPVGSGCLQGAVRSMAVVPPREVIDHGCDPPADWPTRRQRLLQPRNREAPGRRHGRQIEMPDVFETIRVETSCNVGGGRFGRSGRGGFQHSSKSGGAQVQPRARQDPSNAQLAHGRTKSFQSANEVHHEIREAVHGLAHLNERFGSYFIETREMHEEIVAGVTSIRSAVWAWGQPWAARSSRMASRSMGERAGWLEMVFARAAIKVTRASLMACRTA